MFVLLVICPSWPFALPPQPHKVPSVFIANVLAPFLSKEVLTIDQLPAI